MAGARCAMISSLLFGFFATFASAKVRLPGDPKYHVQLLFLEATEGTLSPSFTPERSNYNMRVTQAKATELHVVLMLDLTRYNPRHTPAIMVDGKQLKYSPLDQIAAVVHLGNSTGAVYKEVKIKISDPQGPGGGIFGFMSHERSFEYVVNITKPPQFDEIIKATNIAVTDNKGNEITASPAFDVSSLTQNTYTYLVDSSVTTASLNFTCPSVPGVAKRFDGVPVPATEINASKVFNMMHVFKSRTHASCSYTDPVWAPMSIQRTYILLLEKHVDDKQMASISAELRALPEFGWCSRVGVHDPRLAEHHKNIKASFGNVVANSGFVCRANKKRSMFVSTFSSEGHAEPDTQLVNHETGEAHKMANAIPATVSMTRERQYFRLHVEAGDLGVVYPVVMIWPEDCDALKCPFGMSTRPPDRFAASLDMCSNETCVKDDLEHCCVPSAKCSTYHSGCPTNFHVRNDASSVFCSGVVCSLDKDQDTCCGQLTTTTLTTTTLTTTTLTSTDTVTVGTTATVTGSATTTTATSTTRTSTTTTTTSITLSTTTTTTTTTELVCIESDKVWLPLDMRGVNTSVEHNETACQERCLQTKGCMHFSFWKALQHCHLQDSNATRQEYGFGFESGPPFCTVRNTVTTTTTNPIPENERCMVRGINWLPLMPVAPKVLQGDHRAVKETCQSWCASTYGCARFEVDLNLNLCRLAGADAEAYNGGGLSIVSGPPSCSGVYEELGDFVLRRFGRPQGRGSELRQEDGSASSTAKWASMACSGLLVCAVAISLTRDIFGRRSGYQSSGITSFFWSRLAPAAHGRAADLQLVRGDDLESVE